MVLKAAEIGVEFSIPEVVHVMRQQIIAADNGDGQVGALLADNALRVGKGAKHADGFKFVAAPKGRDNKDLSTVLSLTKRAEKASAISAESVGIQRIPVVGAIRHRNNISIHAAIRLGQGGTKDLAADRLIEPLAPKSAR